jgi:uncharacterized protein (DUF1330 family)
MIVVNKLHHTDEQFAKLSEEKDEGPIFMVNLFKFREKAEYEDGRETQLSGMEAYQLYGAATSDHIARIGGRVVHSSELGGIVCGEVEDLWDAVAIVEYPSISAFLEMVGSDDWSNHAVHRTAGLKGQLNIFSRIPLVT